MLITLIIFIIISNAVTNDILKSPIYSRITIQGLVLTIYISYNNLFVSTLERGISLYGGMFNVTTFTQGFNLFIISAVIIISTLTAFFPRIIASISVLDMDWQKLHNKLFLSNPITYLDKSDIIKVQNKNTKHIANLKDDDQPIEYDKYVDYEEGNFENHGVLFRKSQLKNVAHSMIKTNIREQLPMFTIIEYSLITLFVLCGAVMLMSTGDLISMFLSIELQSYGLYILCTLYRDSESATNSGLTYFLLGGMSSCFILFGSALLYVNTGTTNLDNIYLVSSLSEVITSPNINSFLDSSINGDMANTIHNVDNTLTHNVYKPYYITISLIMIIVGFLFKVSAAPFHFWSPDVYDGIPTIVTTFVAIVAKISIFAFIVQLILNIDFNFLPIFSGGESNMPENINAVTINNNYNVSLLSWVVDSQETGIGDWKNILILSSMMSLIVGSVLGLTQYRIKRLFAYSTISHVGFILLALAVGKIESIQGYIFYILQYTLSNINAFFILVAIGFTLNYRLHNFISFINRLDNNVATAEGKEIRNDFNITDTNNSPIQLINQLKGYFYINSFVAISLAITLFSFVGIPPLIGFFAKQMVLSAALDEGFIFITLVAVITSVIGAVYYLNVIKTMFFYPSGQTNKMFFFPDRVTEESKGPVIESELFITLYTNKDWEYEDTTTYVEDNSYVYRYDGHLSINNWLSITISILTMVILTFMFMPNEWLRAASILSFTLFKS